MAFAALLPLCLAPAVALGAVPRLPWANDTKPDGPCGITYSPRFSHGGGCAEGTAVEGSPRVYCRSFGKQRAIVSAASAGRACAALPWRRYDDPARRAVVVTDATGSIVPSNLTNASSTTGEVCFTAAAPGAFAVYFLPFRWASGLGSGSYCSFFLKPGESVGPDTPAAAWDVLSTWAVASGLPHPQNFTLAAPARGRSFRYVATAGYSPYQSSLRELWIQTKEHGWLANHATAARPSPVKAASGWQPNGASDGHAWAAMDGNRSTLWDPSPSHDPAWLELQFDSDVTIVAISLLAGSGTSDTGHTPKTIQLQRIRSHSPPPPPSPTPGAQPAAAEFVRFESKTAFDSRSPMELMASSGEVAAMVSAASRTDYLTFVSAISNTSTQSVRLDALPASLAASGPNTTVAASGKPGQFVVIQVAILALQAVSNLTVSFSAVGAVPAAAMTCFQTGGTDANGHTMPERPWSLDQGKVGALLVGIAIPEADGVTAELCSAAPHAGSFTLTPTGGKPTAISVSLSVQCDAVVQEETRIDTSDLERLERLAWLNSRAGLTATVTRPYHPLQVSAHAISCLGRTVHLGPSGLPSQIVANGVDLLSTSGVQFAVTAGGADTPLDWAPLTAAEADYTISLDPNGTVASWSVASAATDGGLTMRTEGEMSYDGYINLAVSLKSTKDIDVENIALVASLPQERAKYAVGAGLGDDGAYFPYHNLSEIAWRWTAQAQPGQQPVAGGPVTGGSGFRVWLGDVTAGLHLKLKGSDPGWNRPNGDPNAPGQASPGEQPFPTWANGNRGGWSAKVGSGTVSMMGKHETHALRRASTESPASVVCEQGTRVSVRSTRARSCCSTSPSRRRQ